MRANYGVTPGLQPSLRNSTGEDEGFPQVKESEGQNVCVRQERGKKFQSKWSLIHVRYSAAGHVFIDHTQRQGEIT